MSRNYDNWERLVAAVMKRKLYLQLARQDSISTIFSDSDLSSRLDLSLRFNSPTPVSLGGSCLTDTFETLQQLCEGELGTTILARLLQDVRISDQQYLEAGAKAVTKLLDTVKVGEDEFEQQMVVLGNCRHENVGTPWAYHFSEKTKLIVYDYYRKGSLFDMIHVNRIRPDWKSRVKIAIGAARGVAHIHTQCGGELAHGNIKSSNIFLNSQNYGCVSDFGLAGIVERPRDSWHELESPSQKRDVYRFGLVLLELVFRESPRQSHYVVDRLHSFELYEWILRSFPHKPILFVDELEMQGSRVFVDEVLIDSVAKQDLQRMLEVAKGCLAELPEHRPTMAQVVLELESISNFSLVVKTAQIHQDSISTLFSPAPLSLGSFCITDTFETLQRLGEGELGTTILARLLQDVRISDQQYLEVGAKAVTKLLETVCVREDEFEQQMIVLGNCRHENVVAPWAYYFSETTKLMVYDYYSQGSVFDMLHDNGSRRPNWESRVRIAIGAARGVAHIHAQCGGKLVHGNIKSSNIFVNRQGYGCVSDFGLAAGMLEWSEKWRANDSQLVLNHPTQKSDVFSFG